MALVAAGEPVKHCHEVGISGIGTTTRVVVPGEPCVAVAQEEARGEEENCQGTVTEGFTRDHYKVTKNHIHSFWKGLTRCG